LPQIEALRTKHRTVRRPCDARSLEEGVRQRLADKVSGTMVGLWLLIGEHLRLGTWDLLSGWTGPGVSPAAPRVAMQMVHEAALCVSGIRERRSLTAHDFELLNGLPFVASDGAVHDLLNAHTIDQAQAVQVALGRIRQSRGHFPGALLAIDPHRLPSTSKRHMRRHKTHAQEIARKAMQTFFCLDAVTAQPLCLTSGSSARTVAQATPELLDLAAAILGPKARGVLVLADTEHFTGELLDAVHQQTPFDLLTPMPRQRDLEQRAADLPPEAFGRCWAGLAMAKRPYTPVHSKAGPYWMIVQRSGEDPRQWHYKSFLCTSDRPEVDLLTRDFPQRWHIEEFFNVNQALGWQHAGTQNLQHSLWPHDDGPDGPGGPASVASETGPGAADVERPTVRHEGPAWPGWRRAGGRGSDRGDVLQRQGDPAVPGAVRGLAGPVVPGEGGPTDSLALRLPPGLPIPLTLPARPEVSSNKPPQENRW
jgi:hypothetical protein